MKHLKTYQQIKQQAATDNSTVPTVHQQLANSGINTAAHGFLEATIAHLTERIEKQNADLVLFRDEVVALFAQLVSGDTANPAMQAALKQFTTKVQGFFKQ